VSKRRTRRFSQNVRWHLHLVEGVDHAKLWYAAETRCYLDVDPGFVSTAQPARDSMNALPVDAATQNVIVRNSLDAAPSVDHGLEAGHMNFCRLKLSLERLVACSEFVSSTESIGNSVQSSSPQC
jgi:hypothetical protein